MRLATVASSAGLIMPLLCLVGAADSPRDSIPRQRKYTPPEIVAFSLGTDSSCGPNNKNNYIVNNGPTDAHFTVCRRDTTSTGNGGSIGISFVDKMIPKGSKVSFFCSINGNTKSDFYLAWADKGGNAPPSLMDPHNALTLLSINGGYLLVNNHLTKSILVKYRYKPGGPEQSADLRPNQVEAVGPTPIFDLVTYDNPYPTDSYHENCNSGGDLPPVIGRHSRVIHKPPVAAIIYAKSQARTS